MRHHVETNELFLVALLIVFTAPFLIWKYLKTEQFAPILIVQMAMGVILGPGVFGSHFPGGYGLLFNSSVTQSLDGIANWAVMLFVFIAGLELDLKEAWHLRRENGIVAGLALGVPLIFGCLAACAFMYSYAGAPPEAEPWQFVLGIGMACATTALPVLVILLEKLELLGNSIGQRSMRYASLDDVLLWFVLAILLMNWERIGGQLLFLLAFGGAAFYVRKFMASLTEAHCWYFALIWLVAVSLAADWLGLHFIEGAFLAGAAVDAAIFDRQKLDWLRQNVLMILMPVFFLSSGLKVNLAGGGIEIFEVAAVLLLASVAGKLLGVHIAGRISKWQDRESSIIGWLLQTKGLTMIVFANVLLDSHIISSGAFAALVIVAIVSTMLTVPAVSALLARDQRLRTVDESRLISESEGAMK
jgi:Kef-type K+ transport system membrane component KefB